MEFLAIRFISPSAPPLVRRQRRNSRWPSGPRAQMLSHTLGFLPCNRLPRRARRNGKRGGTPGLSVCGVRSARRSVGTSSDAPLCRSFVTATGLRLEGFADLPAVKPPDKSGRGLSSRVPGHPPQRRYDGEARGANHCQSNCTNQHCIPPLRDGQRPSVDFFEDHWRRWTTRSASVNSITLDFDNFRTIHPKKSPSQTICGASPVSPD